MAKGAANFSQVRQQLPGNNVAGSAMHEQHVKSIVERNLNCRRPRSKLRTTQNTQVSQEGDLGTPKVAGNTPKMGS